ncbi:MAG: hypothetical protein ABIZ52_02545 [Candidatus Limnocylindrales bacterium]
MAGSEPGDRAPASKAPSTAAAGAPPARRLEAPPGARYAEPGGDPATNARGSALTGPLVRALIVALVGAAALLVVGAILALTAGLLFIAGGTGAAVGLVLARAAVPRDGGRPIRRRTVTWLAVALSIGAVAVAVVATWLVARNEGGTLALIDYLLQTFGPFVPAEVVLAAIAAAWGANAGPVQA